MRFVADESVEQQVVDQLRADNHDVFYVAEQAPGLSDVDVLSLARTETRILITSDKDFGELIYRSSLAGTGVVLLRLVGLSNIRKATIVSNVIRDRAAELDGAFAVVEPSRVRFRKP